MGCRLRARSWNVVVRKMVKLDRKIRFPPTHGTGQIHNLWLQLECDHEIIHQKMWVHGKVQVQKDERLRYTGTEDKR